MIYKSKKILLFLVIVLLVLFAGDVCSAALLQPGVKNKIDEQAGQVGAFGGYAVVEGKEGALNLAQTIINAFLSIVGVLLLIYLLHAGYEWMTASGEEEKVEQAKDTIKRAITGIIIIVAAYAISVFVMFRLEAGTLRGGSSPSTTPTAGQTGP